MQRQITELADEQEGAMYDVARAKREGLREEIELFFMPGDVPTTLHRECWDAAFEVAHGMDMSVNLGPDEPQEILLRIKYSYDYGRVD